MKIVIGGFIACIGEMIDCIEFDDNEVKLPVRKKNKDKKVNKNGKLMAEVCKTCAL